MKRVLFLMIILGSLTSSMAIFAAGPTNTETSSIAGPTRTDCGDGVDHSRGQVEAQGGNIENSGGDDSPSAVVPR